MKKEKSQTKWKKSKSNQESTKALTKEFAKKNTTWPKPPKKEWMKLTREEQLKQTKLLKKFKKLTKNIITVLEPPEAKKIKALMKLLDSTLITLLREKI